MSPSFDAMMSGGTGERLAHAVRAVSGVAALAATILSMISIVLQTKNYRKPLLQRYVVRILLMVPIYAISSYVSLISIRASHFLDPIRDIYEAFTIYTFFQLMINYVGGERSLIIMMHGRPPVDHLWPLNYVFEKVDISDPHVFLAIKRGILQYAWLKPLLSLATIIMKACGVYQEGYLSLTSGYLWCGIMYNISVTLSLYALGMFWVCMHHDLKPFRPMPKFLCIKLIIFASYWQGFFLSVLVWLGAIPDNVEGYEADNLAAAIQDALICIEMPMFAVAHWYAFSWQDFADNRRVHAARMPVGHAFRDAFGPVDLIQDTKETLRGDKYAYRAFDSGDKIIAHEDSKSRIGRLRAGMRYERGGKAKYWIPQPGDINVKTPLLGPAFVGSVGRGESSNSVNSGTFAHDEVTLDAEEEELYDLARELEFGDWNYPVITTSEPLHERYPSPHRYQPARSSGNVRGKQKQRQQQQPSPNQSSSSSDRKGKSRSRGGGGSSSSSPGTRGGKAPAPLQRHDTEEREEEEAAALLAEDAQEVGTPWSARDAEETISPGYQVEASEEFRNVWGSSNNNSSRSDEA